MSAASLPLRTLRLAAYPLSRAAGTPPPLPLNLTVSVTYACPSRCRTCDVWKRRTSDLTLDEYARIFDSLDGAPAWVTLSGGDQFLRKDLPEIVRLVRERLRPSVINLPMSGVLTKRVEELLPRVFHESRGSKLVLNLSLDDVGEKHDLIRGYEGNYEKLMRAYRLARDLQRDNAHVSIGLHTVISRFNHERLPAIAEEVDRLAPDAWLSEVAEERAELGTMGKEIAPTPSEYRSASRFLIARLDRRKSRHPVGRLVESLRREYYDLAARTLEERRQVIPCYAGWASAHLAPDGDVWGCCTRAEPMGNVREHGYDFGTVWRSPRARAFRASVKAGVCACPLANAAYTNMLLSPPSLARVLRHFGTT